MSTLLSWCYESRKQLIIIITVVLIGLSILLRWIFGRKSIDKKEFQGKTVIITGANTGIGYPAAEKMALMGATVILACRDEVKAKQAAEEIIEKTKNKNVRYEIVDVSNFDSIEKFVGRINKCHILINNAGAMFPEYTLAYNDTIEKTFLTNYVGPWYLSRLLLPLLASTSITDNCETKIVNLGSRSEMIADYGKRYMEIKDPKRRVDLITTAFLGPFKTSTYSHWNSYGNSKLADMLFTVSLADRLQQFLWETVLWDIPGYSLPAAYVKHCNDLKTLREQKPDSLPRILVNSVSPGVTNTNLTRNMKPFMQWITFPFRYFLLNTSAQGAEAILYGASFVNGITGKYYIGYKVGECSAQSKSRVLADLMWLATEEWITKHFVPVIHSDCPSDAEDQE